jgi:branched-subunit amino acid aminotransferase/4-amino-4-deoxychorismate lyase
MSTIERTEINGKPATLGDLRRLAATNYGHFTSMRVVDGKVRGLQFHLDRLKRSTLELFGSELDTAFVRECLRHAIAGGSGALSVRANVFSRAYDRDRPAAPVEADVLVMVNSATPVSDTPLRLKSFRYERESPHIKHVGTFALFQHRRLAQQAGYDDALFVDCNDCVSEGSIWNVGFFDGEGVVWPDARQLEGVSKHVLQAGLAGRGVRSHTQSIALSDVSRYRAAFFTNSSQPVRAIACVDETEFAIDAEFVAMLAACYDSAPDERI